MSLRSKTVPSNRAELPRLGTEIGKQYKAC
jgi:hypothetical protein